MLCCSSVSPLSGGSRLLRDEAAWRTKDEVAWKTKDEAASRTKDEAASRTKDEVAASPGSAHTRWPAAARVILASFG